jgi:hypothetical protein
MLVRVSVLLLAGCGGEAYRKYLGLIPNSERVPCISDESADLSTAAGCRGASICEAFGHISCWARTGDNDAPKQNAFGGLVQTAFTSPVSKGLAWTVDVCKADIDSDGFTNGSVEWYLACT